MHYDSLPACLKRSRHLSSRSCDHERRSMIRLARLDSLRGCSPASHSLVAAILCKRKPEYRDRGESTKNELQLGVLRIDAKSIIAKEQSSICLDEQTGLSFLRAIRSFISPFVIVAFRAASPSSCFSSCSHGVLV
nr:hypothetical protein CFP56_25889 [Quercus suber]